MKKHTWNTKRQRACQNCGGRRLLRTIREGKPCSSCGHVQSLIRRVRFEPAVEAPTERAERNAFVRAQIARGVPAIEASRRFRAERGTQVESATQRFLREQAERHPDCVRCKKIAEACDNNAPRHAPQPTCRVGSHRAHCTCAGCF
jgi:hypothetical protein